MRKLLRIGLLLAIAALPVGYLVACGGGGAQQSTATGSGSSRSGARANAGLSGGRLRGDEDDDDNPGEEHGHDPHDSDIDGDNDHITQLTYNDRDDREFLSYGHAASAAEGRAIAELVRRYTAAALAGDAKTTCSMFTREYERSVPEDFGRGSAGPAFLRNATTCPQVMALELQHFHYLIADPVKITGVRVNEGTALVFVGATNTPAGYVEVQREHGAWKIIGMLAGQLP